MQRVQCLISPHFKILFAYTRFSEIVEAKRNPKRIIINSKITQYFVSHCFEGKIQEMADYQCTILAKISEMSAAPDPFSQNVLSLYSETGRMIVGVKKLALGVMTKVIEFMYSIFNTIVRVLFTHTHTVNQGFRAG